MQNYNTKQRSYVTSLKRENPKCDDTRFYADDMKSYPRDFVSQVLRDPIYRSVLYGARYDRIMKFT